MARDPLDALFGATAAAPQARSAGSVPLTGAVGIASAPPVRAAGTRSRGGNAMTRTRAALIDGARRAVAADGTRIPMAQIATAAGVAKATLYNHFRTREAVLAALLEDEISRLIELRAGRSLAERLVAVGEAIATNPALRGLAATEPAVVARLARVDTTPGWAVARRAVGEALAGEDRAGVELVLRWLSSLIVTPAGPADIADDVAVLMAGLPVGRRSADALIPRARETSGAASATSGASRARGAVGA